MTTTHAPSRRLTSRATLCGTIGHRDGNDLAVDCPECRVLLLGGAL